MPVLSKDECVGRSQLVLPDDVEVAVTPRARILSILGMQRYTNQENYSFSDGTAASYTSLGYASGDMLVSEPATAAELTRWLRSHGTARMEAVKKQTQGRTAVNGSPYRVETLDVGSPNVSAYRVFGLRLDVSAVVGDRFIHTAFTADDRELVAPQQQVAQFISAIRKRAPFEVPKEVGVCLPFLFIQDKGDHPRGVAVTFRLKSHPDITIWLQDSNGGPVPKGANPDKFTARYDNQFFWDQNYRDRKKTRLLDHDRLKLAGIEGEYSVMELTRPDDTIDYGYFASARADASKVPDPTNIQMFVIRDAKNAAAKGIEPMPKDEFIQLARAIAASVKMRPTRQ